MRELEVGKLYQVKTEKGWVVGEYFKPQPAHSYKYHSMYFDKDLTISPEKTRHVPDAHLWKKVRALPASYPATFTTLDRGLQIRDVSDDLWAQIDILKREIVQLEADRVAKVKELRELCE